MWGPGEARSTADLRLILSGLHGDRSQWQWDREAGALRPMPVVILPGRGTVYDDVARTADMVRDAGFEQVQFGGGRGAHVQTGSAGR